MWFLEDEDDAYELAVFHSHPETQPIPSKTDQELSGLWGGKTFLIYGLKLDELRAWKITREASKSCPSAPAERSRQPAALSATRPAERRRSLSS